MGVFPSLGTFIVAVGSTLGVFLSLGPFIAAVGSFLGTFTASLDALGRGLGRAGVGAATDSLDTLGGVGVATRRPFPSSVVVPQPLRANTSPIISPAKAIKQSFEIREECAGLLIISSSPH